jgi:hypothetical protein
MSKPTPPTHTEYVASILKTIQAHNPDPLYVSGFLAGYLAQLMMEDPWAYKRFQRHMDWVNNRDG